MKKFLLIGCSLIFIDTLAQVGINTTSPNAQLEIKSSDTSNPANTDGILIPKVDVFPATNPTADQDGMLVYLTTDVGTNLKGFYYWDNTNSVWKSISGDKGWSLTGNAGTNVATNFIGTTDNVGLKFKVNNFPAGHLDPILFNTFLGYKSASSLTTGDRNVAFGTQSLYSNTSGYHNSAIGFQSLYNNLDGYENSAFGSLTLTSNTNGIRNSALGVGALNKNLYGSNNVAFGAFSLNNNISGNSNVAIGVKSLLENIAGINNTTVGYLASQFNTTGSDNTSLGCISLFSNESGHNNVAIGSRALNKNLVSNNVAVGYEALLSNTIGTFNTAVGNNALFSNDSGYGNDAFGFQSLQNNTIGIHNAAFGIYTLTHNTIGNYNAAFGKSALMANIDGDNNTAMGVLSLSSNTYGNNNTATGFGCLNDNTEGNENSAFGNNALYSNNTGSNNIAVGYRTLFANTTGERNCANGNYALTYNNGNGNVANGYRAIYKNTTGNGNGGYGEEANPTTTTGWNNIGIGFHSLGQINGSGNRVLGNEIGFDNIGIGLSAGDRSGNNINGCLFLGAFANVTFSNANLTNSTAIGRYATVNQDNTIVLGAISGVNSATSSTRVGIGTYNPICPLQVVGSTNQFGSWAFYARSGSTTTTGFANSTSGNFSIIASDRIQATEFNAVSDARIKNIQSRMDTNNALKKINQLQVTNYTYKDWLQKGTAIKTGFIAQEVEQIIPSAVNKATNYIPNIMQMPHAFCVDTLKNTLTVNLEKPFHIKKGEKIRLYNKSTPIESEVIIIDDYNFEIMTPAYLKTDDLFVYGTEVSDFRSVDYDQIHTLSVAAIQELSKENELLKQKIQQLESKNNTTDERLQKLESALNSYLSKSN